MKKTLFLIIAAIAIITVSCTKETLDTGQYTPADIPTISGQSPISNILVTAVNPDAELFTVFYGYTDGVSLEGTGSIDMTIAEVEIVSTDKSGYHLMYAEGILRDINNKEYSETIWSATAPKINWSKPSYSELPYFLHYKDIQRTSKVNLNKVAGHASGDFYQTVVIYYVDPSNKVYQTELNWDDMNTFPEIELTTENH